MITLEDNEVINKLHKLLSSAITLKEKFDTHQPNEVLLISFDLYKRDLDELKRICPASVFEKGDLIRHSTWMNKYIRKGTPESCYGDINSICHTDIFLVEMSYLDYIINTNEVSGKFYDWHIIHPKIYKIAKTRFESSHYSDAVEASFKEINSIVKSRYKLIKNIEIDGDTLMRRAFTSTDNNNFNPVIILADNTNESGKNIQQGYMDIFAGVMRGIRNPNAHANISLDPDEAWEMIVLASHLMRMLNKFKAKIELDF